MQIDLCLTWVKLMNLQQELKVNESRYKQHFYSVEKFIEKI